MPEKYKGYLLFEYEVVEVDARLGTATIRYTEKVIKPLGVQFESYKETPGVEQRIHLLSKQARPTSSILDVDTSPYRIQASAIHEYWG